MHRLVDFPLLAFIVCFALLSLAAWIGASIIRGRMPIDEDSRAQFDTVLAATLTLLGLLIGFSFSMALGRYEQRKNYEEAEANAIGTEYLRVDFLPAADAAAVRLLLKNYVDQRILFYITRDLAKLHEVHDHTALLQQQLWTAIRVPAAAQPDFNVALAVSGMNDVINSEGYTQAAWWNRIPTAAWILLITIAVLGSLMVGYGGKAKSRPLMRWVLPLIVSISVFLIADIDSARGGMIRVKPQNLYESRGLVALAHHQPAPHRLAPVAASAAVAAKAAAVVPAGAGIVHAEVGTAHVGIAGGGFARLCRGDHSAAAAAVQKVMRQLLAGHHTRADCESRGKAAGDAGTDAAAAHRGRDHTRSVGSGRAAHTGAGHRILNGSVRRRNTINKMPTAAASTSTVPQGNHAHAQPGRIRRYSNSGRSTAWRRRSIPVAPSTPAPSAGWRRVVRV